MKIKILTAGLELTPAIKKYAEDKIGSLSKIWSKEPAEEKLDLELARTAKHRQHGEVFYAEATGRAFGKPIRAEAESEDLYAAIDQLKDILKKEITGTKEKKLTRNLRSARRAKEK